MPLGFSVLSAVLALLAGAPAGDDVYSWTDAEGGAHYTNDASAIPQRYRDQARTLNGHPVSFQEESTALPPAAEVKAATTEEASKTAELKPPAERVEELEESAPPPLPPGAAAKLDEAGWRKRFQRANERVHRAELTLNRDKEQLSRVSNEEGYMVVDAYGRTMTAGRATALKMQVGEDQRVLTEARDSLEDLERAAAREAIPLEWRR